MLLRITAFIALLSLLSACTAPIIIAGSAAAAGVVIAKDRRTAGTMLDDERTEIKAGRGIAADKELLQNTHVNVTSFNGIVLLTGEAVLPMYKAKVEEIVRREQKVREVRNELIIASPSTAAERSRDTLITTRVKSRLFGEANVDSSTIKVVTERATVYLMGLVKHKEADHAVQVARTTPDVTRIVKVFEYID